MDENGYIKLTVDPEHIENMLIGIEIAADGLAREAFSYNAMGVLHADSSLNEGQNAMDWLAVHYDTVGGVLHFISGALGLINQCITDDELCLTAPSRKGGNT